MKFLPVKSSNLSKIGYDTDTKQLIVEINNGKQYQYDNVPEKIYINFIHSISKGKYFHSNIKNVYTCTTL